MSSDIVERPEESTRPTLRERSRTPEGQTAIKVGGVVAVLTVVLLAFGIWWPLVSLSPSASDTQDEVKNTILVFSIAAAPVMAIVWGVAYYSLRHWRVGATQEPPEDGPAIRDNNRISLVWVISSAVLTAFLLIWGLAALTSTTTIPPDAKPLTINVVGQQWVWNFQYPEDGGITSAELILPKDRPVIFNVTSADVIHSFWIPEMGVKVDANPAVTTTTMTTPNKLGGFNVRCAELCGLNHAYMETTGTVVSAADFDKWVTDEGGTVGVNVPLNIDKVEAS
jgi:cytochrome c oxidase subunit 2